MSCRKNCLLIAMLLIVSSLFAQTSHRINVPTSIEKWITSNFVKGKTPPFSFV